MGYPRPTLRLRIARLFFRKAERDIISDSIRAAQIQDPSSAEYTAPNIMRVRLWATFNTLK